MCATSQGYLPHAAHGVLLIFLNNSKVLIVLLFSTKAHERGGILDLAGVLLVFQEYRLILK